MKNQLSHIVNIPPFIYRIYNLENSNFFIKILIIFKGKITQFAINNLNGSLFCKFMNLFYGKYSRIYFDNKNYYKFIADDKNIFYPNKRVTRVISPKNFIFNNIYDSYCLYDIDFEKNDLIVDCGANIGELNFAFWIKGLEINYIGIEPETQTFDCLVKNKLRESDIFYNFALSNKNGFEKLYLDSVGGNSSIVYFGKNSFESVETKTLDSIKFDKGIKLLKLEAEGFEPEILAGGLKTLSNVEYVAVDFGSERGIEEKNTTVEVNDILYSNNFKLITYSEIRQVGLYKNHQIKEKK